MKAEEKTMAYRKQEILFSVSYGRRKTLEIAVLPDKRVEVKAPTGTPQEDVEKRISRRSRWIRKQQGYFSQFIPRTTARKYVSGETHLYLGRQYRLSVARGLQNDIKLKDGRFVIVTTDPEKQAGAQRLLEKWYRAKAKTKFQERLTEMVDKIGVDEARRPAMQIRKMKTRWGSLSRKNILTLNADLICAPRECIDYVILHELCHMRHRNHGRDFHRMLNKFMPDWQRRKLRLERLTSGN